MSLDLSRAAERFKTGDYVVTRRTGASYDADGIKVDGLSATFSIPATVQPLSGRELEALAPAQLGKEIREVLCRTELKTRTPTCDADQVTIDDEQWEVIASEVHHVRSHDGVIHTHCKAMVARLVQSS